MTANSETDVSSPLGTPTRRTIVKGAAWTIPVLALATQTPAAAASAVVCPSVPGGAGWVTGNPQTGSLTAAAGLNGWGGTGYNNGAGQSNVFVSLRDNAGTTDPATVSTSVSLPFQAGGIYTFTIQVLSQHGDLTQRPVPTRASTVQTLDISLGGTQLEFFSTYADVTGGTQTVIRNSTSSYPWQTYTYTYYATTSGLQTLSYLFTLPPHIGVSQDDIFATLPVFTSCVVGA